LVIHKKLSLVTLSLCPRRITAGCVIVFEMFRQNGDGTLHVAVKFGGDSKKMMGLGAISFDKAFSNNLPANRSTTTTEGLGSTSTQAERIIKKCLFLSLLKKDLKIWKNCSKL
jgi:hypothetical protein